MTKVSDEAREILKEAFFDPNIPQIAKERIRDQMRTLTLLETQLRDATQIARDTTRPPNVRLQAIDAIVRIYKGEPP